MSDPLRTIVNGASLRINVGKQVSIIVKVDTYDIPGTLLKGITTDDATINVNLSAPLETNLRNRWVEVIGQASRPDTINNAEVIIFPDDGQELDKKSHNMMIQFLSNAPNVYSIR
ncbi:uncharacterized protein LOC129788799 [Lutzomyia longipalpis]|uniref:Putative replication factor a protein 3 n=1 Tax=Lutzomyia longipalpis TaxID=7200 RepID=A0A7G3ARB3_LUTLO|nr:uncharacterized protein LOC129788799 [Lutzomyia longipalpis]